MNTPKVSVYIPSHNYGKFLPDAIESVLRQSFEDWELLIIDDGSSDDTWEVMRRYKSDRRVRLLRTEGIGLHGVCNLALREATGEYIIRLDGDDIFDENILLVLSTHLDANPDVALVFPDYHLLDEFGEVFAYERREKLYRDNHNFDEAPNGACFLARRQVLLDVGGYNDELRAQDGYYIWRKLIKKHKCTNINLPLFFYRQHGTNLTSKPERILSARREIKKQTSVVELSEKRPFIAVIPCRRHYEFCEDLWDKKLAGKTLLEWALDRCIATDLLDYIVVTCDNDRVLETLAKYNDPRLVFEPRSQRETLRSENVTGTLRRIVQKFDPEAKGITVNVYIKTPFVKPETVEEAVFTLAMHDADCSLCVEPIQAPLFKRSSYGLSPINKRKGITSDFETVFAQSRSVTATKNTNILVGALTGPRVVNYVVPKQETFLIDCSNTFKIASVLAQQSSVRRDSLLIKGLERFIEFEEMLP